MNYKECSHNATHISTKQMKREKRTLKTNIDHHIWSVYDANEVESSKQTMY